MAAAWRLPICNRGIIPIRFAEEGQAMYKELFECVEDKSKPIIVMGYLQAAGLEISQDDCASTIIIRLECVSLEAFSSEITYTALKPYAMKFSHL